MLVSSLCLGADFKIYSYDIIKLDGEIVIDGILNESTWSIGQPISKLIQKDPHPRALSRENIEIRVATDNEFIYAEKNTSGIYVLGVDDSTFHIVFFKGKY